MKTVGVIGFGFMGSRISLAFSIAGFDVHAIDVSSDRLAWGIEYIKTGEYGVKEYVQRGELTEEKIDEVLSRISTSTNIASEIKDADFVVEAVSEKLDLKKEVFKQLDKYTREDVVLTSNTSTLSISVLSGATRRPDRVAGFHMIDTPIIEIVKGLFTSNETINLCCEVCKKLRKEYIVANDMPGFTLNRILWPSLNEAIRAYAEGVASKEDIDKSFRLGMPTPLGPFQLMDIVGLDIVYDIFKALYEGFGMPQFKPHPLLKQLVLSGNLGKKTGKGWYEYK